MRFGHVRARFRWLLQLVFELELCVFGQHV